MHKIIGRKKELKELNDRYNSKKKELCILYGRRRIGKSFLLTNFVEDKEKIIFQAKQDSLYGNLKSFSYEINKEFNINTNYVYSSWQEALDVVSQHYGNKRFMLVIDEYPYIVSQDSSFPSVLQEFYDRSKDNLFLILSGSDISMLRNEIINHASPLYKRRTFEIELKKLPYKEALEFVKGVKDNDKAHYLSLFSTYPYYLEAIDYSSSFEDNIKKLLFNQYGSFFSLPDQLLSNSTYTQDVYNSILEAISVGKRSNQEIALYIKESEAKVSKYLTTLLNSELVEKRNMFNGNKKSIYYEISDQLLKFWFIFIYPNIEKIKINSELVYQTQKEKIGLFLNHGFEHICGLYIDELNSSGYFKEVFDHPKIYKVEKSKLNRSIEIDGLSVQNNKLLVLDCKDKNEKYSLSMFEHLKKNISVFPNKYIPIYYIFSRGGFSDSVLSLKDKNIHLVTYKDLLNCIFR